MDAVITLSKYILSTIYERLHYSAILITKNITLKTMAAHSVMDAFFSLSIVVLFLKSLLPC